eukprot:g13269.t1
MPDLAAMAPSPFTDGTHIHDVWAKGAERIKINDQLDNKAEVLGATGGGKVVALGSHMSAAGFTLRGRWIARYCDRGERAAASRTPTWLRFTTRARCREETLGYTEEPTGKQQVCVLAYATAPMEGDAMMTTVPAAAAATDCSSNGGTRETTARGGGDDAYVNTGSNNCSDSGGNSMDVGGTRGWAGARVGADDRLGHGSAGACIL